MRILFVGSDQAQPLSCFSQHQFAYAFWNGYEESSAPENCRKDFPSLEEAVCRFQPHLAVIGVPNYRKNRKEYEELLMRRKIPLLIQKFRLKSFEDFEEIRQIQQETGARVYVGEFYRLNPLAATVRSLLQKGRTGPLEYIRWESGINGEICPWESAYDQLAIHDLAFHHISVMQSLFGLDVRSVYARSCSPRKGSPAKATFASPILEMRNGALIDYTVDWHCSLQQTDFFGTARLEGVSGGIEIQHGKVFFQKWGEEKQEIPLASPAYATGLEQTAAYLLGETSQSPVTLEEFSPVMEILKAMTRSAHTGNVIYLEEEETL